MTQGQGSPAGQARGLADRYARHNNARGRGFVYGGRQRVEAMSAFLPAGPSSVLDLGCRDGALARALGFPRGSVIGIDIDPDALNAAVSDDLVHPIQADLWAPTIPVASGSVDLVVAGEILEHVPFPDQFISEAARVLRPGGVLVGSTPNAFRLKNRIRFMLGRPFETDPTHLHHFSRSQLGSLLSSHFGEVHVRPCVGRAAWFLPSLTATDLVWRAS